MALDTKNLTEYIWLNDEKWKVEQVLCPTPYDDFLLVSKYMENTVHEDGTTPVEMLCIDCHNQEFYPDTEYVRKVMETMNKVREDFRDTSREARDKIKDTWLDLVID